MGLPESQKWRVTHRYDEDTLEYLIVMGYGGIRLDVSKEEERRVIRQLRKPRATRKSELAYVDFLDPIYNKNSNFKLDEIHQYLIGDGSLSPETTFDEFLEMLSDRPTDPEYRGKPSQLTVFNAEELSDAELPRLLDRLQSVMDRKEWTPETLDQIADIVRGYGYEINDPI